jgi:RND family efflux transporter MFP subunit
MRKLVLLAVIVAAALAGVAFYTGIFSRSRDAQASAADAARTPAGGAGGAGPQGGRGGAGGRQGGVFRPPMTVELASAARGDIAQQLTVVGNLVGDATVSVVPKAAGRLDSVTVRLGDRVSRGQRIAKIEDEEIQQQVKQAEAALEVSKATIRQREADLELAKTNAERSRNLFQRQLLPQQTLDDSEAKYQSAVAALDLARAQDTQSRARYEELKVTLDNTIIVSPVDGFVARRAADPGAYVSPNAPIVDVVDITRVRLVVNVVEKDLKAVQAGDMARVEVDAFPGESFSGRIARVAPVLDPATRTSPVEIEIPNPTYRLKPGMYARVGIVTETRPNALVVPTNAVIDSNGTRGVFVAMNDVAAWRQVKVGIENEQRVEILDGVREGDRIVTIGAASLRDGDHIALNGGGAAGRGGQRGGNGQRSGNGRRGGGNGQRGNGQPGTRDGGAPAAAPVAGGAPANSTF